MQADRQIGLLMQSARVQAAFGAIDRLLPQVIDQTLALSRIASPTFAEVDKARHVRGIFEGLGLRDVHIDEAGNAVARRPGAGAPGAILIAAHIDTVFPVGTELTGRRENGFLRGPSVGDNSLGIAAMLARLEPN